jgi:hypothetical protein
MPDGLVQINNNALGGESIKQDISASNTVNDYQYAAEMTDTNSGTTPFTESYLLKQDGFFLLLQDGSFLVIDRGL